MLAFLVPNIYIICKGKESYPFTPAPMFGHYVGDSTLFYSIEFTANGKNFGTDHLNNHMVKRMFFDQVYWSVDPESPLGNFDNDSKQAFENRLTNFFSAYYKHLTSDTAIHRIDLSVTQYNRKYQPLAKHNVGYYDHTTGKFIHTWKGR
ncbi:hypothetical protein DJ568_07685 [Mucilaginibacter hurinus]|uniref:Uncharacterized protein n=2 Tax=Mucilaginibacter hurinus TaxID=2201324 RepID=A0A367GQK9_9SPHI|nr:hypothetical protein DJ568_07685 [Mucilaginibacter hurinus]